MADAKKLKVGVVGSGVMGHGIAQVLAVHGHDVLIADIAEQFLDNALRMIRSGRFGFERAVRDGKITSQGVEEAMARLKTTVNYDDLAECDLIIEAITEKEDLKRELFKKLDRIVKKDAIFASNTSGIMISSLSAHTDRGNRFIGMHWFNPPQVMKLIEVVKGPETSESVIKQIMDLSTSMGKVPILVNDGPGFFTTRFLNSFLVEAFRMLESGVSGVEEIDRMSKLAFGFPMGPFELADFIGLDTILHISEYMYEETKRQDYAAPSILKKLVLSGYNGDKKGSKGGFYTYYGLKK